MKAGVLYSGGKDSSLVAVILRKLGYEVELLTVNFGIFDSWKPAANSANSLGFKHSILNGDKAIIEDAVDMILEDGFPNNGINYVHKQSLNIIAENYKIVADGTRRDDKIPKLKKNEIRCFEDKGEVEYITIEGFGHKTIKNLSKNWFEIQKEKSNLKNNSDYEIEIRYLITNLKGKKITENIFPDHLQSRVLGWKKNE
jgi:tRNA methyltransferase